MVLTQPPGSNRARGGRAAWTIARLGPLIGAVLVLPALMAVLALALTMLTRMLVERELEPALHQPTFWVWFVICLSVLALPIIVTQVRSPRGPARSQLPHAARLWLTFTSEEAGPVIELTLQRADGVRLETTLVRAHELEPADVALLEGVTDVTAGLSSASGDRHELTRRGLELLAGSDGTLRLVLDELLARPLRHELAAQERADLEAARTLAQETVDVSGDPTVVVPRGPRHRVLSRVSVALWVVLGLVVVILLGWRALSDAGVGPDLDDAGWAMSVGGATVLAGPFVIWGWYGVLHYVRAREARGRGPAVAARACSDFWLFGLCSALVMVFLGGLAVLALWVMDEGLTGPLVAVVVTTGFALLARTSWRRWETSRRVPRR